MSGLRFWLWVIAIVGITDGLIFLFLPHLVTSSAYTWATNMVPAEGWGVVFLFAGLNALYALKRERVGPARMAMVVHGFGGAMFGTSIFALTLEGVTSALTGATKWWIFFVVAAYMMSTKDFHDEIRDEVRS